MLITLDPNEVQRQVVLAFALEAAIPKEDCTSRFADVGPNQKFEYFLVSAVNSGRHFFELADRINAAQRQPKVIYDLAYRAMMDSQKSRKGKIVNYGLVEAMLPVVVSRCVYGKEGLEALGLVQEVLRSTSKYDVRHVAEMRKTIYSRSDKEFKRNFVVEDRGETVFDHYEHHREIAHEASKLFVSELMDGMPLTRMLYESLKAPDGSLTEKIRDGFCRVRKTTALPAGALADFMAAALYLHISDEPDAPAID